MRSEQIFNLWSYWQGSLGKTRVILIDLYLADE